MAATAPLRFEASPIPTRDLSYREAIVFRHPGYPEPNILLRLPRVDRVADTTTFGVCHRTALLACQIIADNSFATGRLSLDRSGQQRVDVAADSILTARSYYFFLSNSPTKYPIVPSFRDWEFPHYRIPDSWPQIQTPSNEDRCAVTNYSYRTESAHLVPREETIWFNRNEMSSLVTLDGDIDNSANIIPLRPDIHQCLDRRWLVIVPKVAGAGLESAQYVTHILSGEAAEIWPIYHNTLVQYLPLQSRPYLFAHFAWAILFHVKNFITQDEPRNVVRISVSTDAEGNREIKRNAEFLTGKQLADIYGGGGSRGATSKRKAGGSNADDGDSIIDSSDENSDVHMEDLENFWGTSTNRCERREGRRRKQISSETVPDTLSEDEGSTLLGGDKAGERPIASQDSLEMVVRLK